jgi:hypothetical protein
MSIGDIRLAGYAIASVAAGYIVWLVAKGISNWIKEAREDREFKRRMRWHKGL